MEYRKPSSVEKNRSQRIWESLQKPWPVLHPDADPTVASKRLRLSTQLASICSSTNIEILQDDSLFTDPKRLIKGSSEPQDFKWKEQLVLQPTAEVSSSSSSAPMQALPLNEIPLFFVISEDCTLHVDLTLSGVYSCIGFNHDRPAFQQMPKAPLTLPLPIFLYFWDQRDDTEFNKLAGYWFGLSIGGDQVWGHAPGIFDAPPETGWKVPITSLPRKDILVLSQQRIDELFALQLQATCPATADVEGMTSPATCS
jgi:hypothetical protein